MAEITLELLQNLPKADLHCHLDGSMRLGTILELAEKQGVKLPADTPEGLAGAIHAGQICSSLEEYLDAFPITLSVIQDEESLYRVAYELAEDAAAENIRYMEVRYSPILHQQRSLSLDNIVEPVLQGLARGEKDFGIRCGVIICGIRSISADTSIRLAKLAVAYRKRGVVGFDLAGAEYNYPAKEHREAFYIILNNNINCTAHAGEAYGPASIMQAIHYCGAHRIGHGTRLWEDEELMDYCSDHRIALEICLSSNIQTGSVKDFASHPVRRYFDYGLRVVLNTDNRLITDTTLSKEFYLAHMHFGFTLEEIKQLIFNSFKAAFQPFRERKDMLRGVMKELERFS